MKYSLIDGISKKLSRLVYGTPNCLMEGKPEESIACLETAYECGFRVFDTANGYGKAEEMIGLWLKECGRRGDIVLHDKGFNPGQKGSPDVFSADTLREQVELSLKRLQTDYLDIYVLHRDDPRKDPAEIIELLNCYKKEHVIGRFGVSNWSLARLQEANAYAASKGLEGFSICSPCFSLADFVRDPWGGSITISGDKNKEFREWLIQNQMPVFNYSALARGYMSGAYKTYENRSIEDVLWWAPIEEYHCPKNKARLERTEILAREKGCAVSTIALAWLFGQQLNIFPIVNSAGKAHLEEAIAAFDLVLTEEECNWLQGE